MAKKQLAERLKTGELYFVFHDIDFDTGDFRMLAYGDGTPRIYKKGALDPRVGDIPICRNLRTAVQQIKRGAIGVLLPLSVLLDLFGSREAVRWAATMHDELAAEMRAYIKRWKETQKHFRLSA
ncbi:MAG: hypothetical protein H6824_10415 [Planctomycetaceae bacterium]|nr:hypothetical protein [Planctomycetaceae bacterium]